ncbi:MAG: S24 family peptidase [Anaerorhabdus sp.]|uniref:LexA family protein n=1 Tax=Anaerorhabdus sp. TaxID=1872524 RepID=UPI002B216161|nr:S24 family peptidase [Anaerorhabdus sp.]MEA4874024.1 S24 family peptidase [Anaerorhabdus sp.]
MNFRENLRTLRKINKTSQDELARFLGYKSFTTIQKWEDGTSIPPMPIIQKIASFFSIPLEDMINRNLSKEVIEMKPVPILGTVKTGLGLFAEENILGYEYVAENEALKEYFYLNVIGDSMKNVRIIEGDCVCIRRQDSVENGEIAVVLLENNEVTLKRVFFKENKMILQPENENYSPMIFTQEDIEEKGIKILGKLVHNKIKY